MSRSASALFAYPRLSKWDLALFRVGGPGLGNLLFTWGRAMKYCRDHQAAPIWPTWPQLKIGPWLRAEKDKRAYTDLFEPSDRYVRGLGKLRTLATLPRIEETSSAAAQPPGPSVVMFEGNGNGFADLVGAGPYLGEQFAAICRGYAPAETDFRTIRVHVRMGDFASVTAEQLARADTPNVRLPLEWYVEKITQVRDALGGRIPVQVFSDAQAQALAPLMQLGGVETYAGRTAALDLLSLSRAGILIGSNSTFSQWARFMGAVPTVWFRASQSRWPHFRAEGGLDCESRMGDGLDPQWVVLAQERIKWQR